MGAKETNDPAMPWMVQVKGEKCSTSWEISVVRRDDKHGQKSYGWFGNTKILVSHSGGGFKWAICKFVWDRHIQTANDLCDKLNAEASSPTNV